MVERFTSLEASGKKNLEETEELYKLIDELKDKNQ